MALSLLPMSPAEFAEFRATNLRLYAEENVRAGRWDASVAVERSNQEFTQLLPKGEATPDHFLRHLVDEPGPGRVGSVWWAVQRNGPTPDLFVYWLGVDPPYRRRGYAAAALRSLEAEGRRIGARRIGLHVFGSNAGARALYEKVGYQVTSVLMSKSIAPL